MSDTNQVYLVACHQQETLREAITLRLNRLGYKATPHQTHNSDVQFSITDGVYGNYKYCESPKKLSVDEFFQPRDLVHDTNLNGNKGATSRLCFVDTLTSSDGRPTIAIISLGR